MDDEPDGADSGGNGVGGSLDRQIRSVEAVLEDLRRRRIISGAGGIVSSANMVPGASVSASGAS